METFARATCKDVTFITAVADPNLTRRVPGASADDAFFVYIVNDEKINRMVLEVFVVGSRLKELSDTISNAFQV